MKKGLDISGPPLHWCCLVFVGVESTFFSKWSSLISASRHTTRFFPSKNTTPTLCHEMMKIIELLKLPWLICIFSYRGHIHISTFTLDIWVKSLHFGHHERRSKYSNHDLNFLDYSEGKEQSHCWHCDTSLSGNPFFLYYLFTPQRDQQWKTVHFLTQ